MIISFISHYIGKSQCHSGWNNLRVPGAEKGSVPESGPRARGDVSRRALALPNELLAGRMVLGTTGGSKNLSAARGLRRDAQLQRRRAHRCARARTHTLMRARAHTYRHHIEGGGSN